MCLGMMHLHTASGQAKGYLPKLSGSMLVVADLKIVSTHGETISTHEESIGID